jgi:hypothetical protein
MEQIIKKMKQIATFVPFFSGNFAVELLIYHF